MHLLRWITLGAISGTLAGFASWVFLTSLDRVTAERLANPWLLYLLPLAGLVIGLVYTHWGGRATRGKTLLLFGSGAILPIAVGCVIAYVASSHRGVYASQRIDVAKGPAPVSGLPTAAEWRRTRRESGDG